MFKVEKDGYVTWFTLNQPEKRNSMTWEFFDGIIDHFNRFDQDPEVRVIVIKGEGKSFTAGIDLATLTSLLESTSAGGRENLRQKIIEGQGSAGVIENCRKPVIAAIHSHCIGAGVDLACACDIRLASRDAVFSIKETKLAVVADLGTLQRMPRIVGEGWFNELALSGRDFSAGEALKMGFITRICEDRDSLYKEAGGLAHEIAANSPLAVEGVKDTVRFSRENGVKAGLEYVAQKNAAILMCDDLKEAVQAFMEKRRPDFKGR